METAADAMKHSQFFSIASLICCVSVLNSQGWVLITFVMSLYFLFQTGRYSIKESKVFDADDINSV